MLTRSLAKKARHDSAVKVHLPPGVLQLILAFNDGSRQRHEELLKEVHKEMYNNIADYHISLLFSPFANDKNLL